MKILLVEDDSRIAEVIAVAFSVRWPEAEMVSTSLGQEAIIKVETEHPDLMVLDLGLPDIDGFDVLKQVRLFSTVPIIILTARDEESSIVKGLEWGADDYIIKPFRQLELMSRAQALMRRYHLISQVAIPDYRDLHFGQSAHQLFVGKRQVSLTSNEVVLLTHLMRNAEKVVPTSRLADAIWGMDYPGSHEAIRVYIHRLRIKIEDDPNHPQYIHTYPRVGYSLQEKQL
ncbi:MAG: response regulator transcription factor [Dehalococcoidia bacterium]|nr:response regulator transcription factor [Dehalococcoidia bacterium]